MNWVASNCGCGDPIEVNRCFQARQCNYFEMPIINDYRSRTHWKRRVRGAARGGVSYFRARSEEHTSELQSQSNIVCRLLLEKKKQIVITYRHNKTDTL